MMKMRQQQEITCFNINKQKALLIHNNNKISHTNTDDNVIKGSLSLINMANYGLDDNYERDESPVSVISHSATVVSQPSSGCTSMDHHLHHLIINPNNVHNPDLINPNDASLLNKQKVPNPVYHFPHSQEQLSIGTSAASTSEDDSAAYNLPTLFFEVAPLQEELTKKSFAKSVKRKSSNSEGQHVADSFNSDDDDDDEHMISVDLKGSQQENPIVLSLKNYGGKILGKEDEKQAVDKISAKLKQYGEWKKEQKLTRSTSKGQEELLVRPKINAHASKIDNYADNTRIMATNYTNIAGNLEVKSFTGPQLASKSGNYSLEKASQNLASRKRTINSAKVGVPSKWDDAEKWLCYDNHHASHHNKAKNSTIYARNLHRTHANGSVRVDKSPSANRENLSITKVHECKGNYSSPNGENLNASKVHECKGNYSSPNGENLSASKVHESKGNYSSAKGENLSACKVHEFKGNYSSPNGENLSVSKVHECKDTQYATPIKGNLGVSSKVYECTDYQAIRGNLGFDKASEYKDNVACATAAMQNINVCVSQRSNSNEKWAGSNLRVRQRCDIDYMSSGEIVRPHVLNHKLAAISVSDGEIHTNHASHKPYLSSQTSISSGSISGGEKTKDNFKQTFARTWIKDNRIMSAQCRTRECDDLSSEEIANNQNLAANCASDGKIRASYAFNQQYNSSASYTQRFKQHLVLQKLRRKCSPNNGGKKGALQNVGEDNAQNLVAGKNRTNIHAVSRLFNLSMQASPQKDQIFRQGEYHGKTQSEGGNIERKEAASDTISEARMQTEFVVQTPTHGRSASMKDACTEVSPSLSRRDMGTQMTPSESSPITSKCTSPLQNTSPARHNTPAQTSPASTRHMNSVIVTSRDNLDHGVDSSAVGNSQYKNVNALELESCHWAKLELRELPAGGQDCSEKNTELGSVFKEWSPAYNGIEDETNVNEGDYPSDNPGGLMKRLSVLDSRAAAWQEAEKAKFNAKYKREEARINAWEGLQRAKAEAELKKLEVKLERLRSRATERVLSKMAAAEKRAEEMRVAAEELQNEQMRKVRERACKLRKNALFPGSFAVCFARNFVP